MGGKRRASFPVAPCRLFFLCTQNNQGKMSNPTSTALELMRERNIHKCQVEGCENPGEEAHHCLYRRRKGVKELNDYENFQLVCSFCHRYTGRALTYENRVNFWRWACDFYGKEHMINWHNSLPLKVKEKAYK